MRKDTFYAVVDLETTGSNYKNNDRIIQFGCTLIQNKEIVQTVDFTVNPLCQIPNKITKLTGISQRMVEDAPIFSDVAEFIYQLLDGCIFVAHNVSFDLNFLNAALSYAGVPEIKAPAIDTVDLARILLPKSESYTLSDLSDAYHLSLKQAHNAGEDAEATARLLLMLEEKASRLPLVTLEDLERLTSRLRYDTSIFFTDIMAQLKKNPPKLREDLEVINGIVLKHQNLDVSDDYRMERHYPKTSSAKEEVYGDYFEMRVHQQEMMDDIYDYLLDTSPDYHLAIESPAGSGKTLGYLLPLVYKTSIDTPIVISTYSTVLQHQLVEKDIPILEKIVDFPIITAILKSRSHYIDLEGFNKKRLSKELDQTEIIYTGKTLVWLTETFSGDFDEFLRVKDTHTYWEDIRTHKHPDLLTQSAWADSHFYLLSRRKAEKAMIIITNHAFLCHDFLRENSELPPISYYVFDEAHHLPDISQEVFTQQFSFRSLSHLIQRYFSNNQNEKLLEKVVKVDGRLKSKLPILTESMQSLLFELETLYHQFVYDFTLYDMQSDEDVDYIFHVEDLTPSLRRQTRLVIRLMQESGMLFNQIVDDIMLKYEESNNRARQILDECHMLRERFLGYIKSFTGIVASANVSENKSSWLHIPAHLDVQALTLKGFENAENNDLKKQLAEMAHVIFVSGTLVVKEDGQTILDNFIDKPLLFKKDSIAIQFS